MTGGWRGPLRPMAVDERIRGGAPWLLAVLVVAIVYFSPRHVASASTVIGGVVGAGLLVLAVRRPDRALLALIAFLPFQALVFAGLWSLGMPASIVRHLSAWKEILALGVVLSGVGAFLRSGRQADLLDRLALAFVLFAGLYLLLQPEIVPSAPSSSSIRLLSFREDAGFVLLFLGARHAPLGPGFVPRAARTLLFVAALTAAIGCYEAISSSGWNRFVVHTIRYPAYQATVLGTQPPNPADILTYTYIGGTRVVRIGSVFLNELNFAFYLILPFALGLERCIRRNASPAVVIATALVGAALLLTETRSALLGALVVVLSALAPAAGRERHWRTQVTLVLAALALVAVPLAVSSGVVRRFGQVNNQHNQSTAGHIAGFWSGLRTIESHPLGQGLGTAAGIGQRFSVTGYQVPENTYLDVGDELGVVPMLIFVALALCLVLWLRRVARVRGDPLASAVWAASAGIALTAWFLQTWLDFGVAWTFWGIAGAVVGLAVKPVAVPENLARERRPVSESRQAGALATDSNAI